MTSIRYHRERSMENADSIWCRTSALDRPCRLASDAMMDCMNGAPLFLLKIAPITSASLLFSGGMTCLTYALNRYMDIGLESQYAFNMESEVNSKGMNDQSVVWMAGPAVRFKIPKTKCLPAFLSNSFYIKIMMLNGLSAI